ncbi:12060_t:CDS:2 [Funneliformis geosporum]|uniref:12060_t:CDS:1 n=1 Tax=Funneliformis geosporum TaxID=1117311 RepID=A0A9W4SLL1_9GLOM|nr:12060_t:CDS:2 [Funneliformis geosporum]
MTTKNNNLKKNKTGWREIDVSELERMQQPGYRRINQGLTPNATPLAKSKYEICKNILRYKREHNLSEKEIGKLLGIKQVDKLEYLLFRHIDYFTLDELVDYASVLFTPFHLAIHEENNLSPSKPNGLIYLAYQSHSQPNLLTNSVQLTQLEQERNHYQTLYQNRVQKDLEHDQTQKIQQLTHHLQQLEHNLSQERETKTLYQQKATDLETSLMNLAKSKLTGKKESLKLQNYNIMVIQTNELEFKGKTLQEYLEWKYPAKEDKEGVKEIIIGNIDDVRIKFGELDLREFKNLEKIVVNGTSYDAEHKLNSLKIGDCANLKFLGVSFNNLTSVEFLKQLVNPEKLQGLFVNCNNIEPTDIEIFSPFVNLSSFRMGTTSRGLNFRNRFYGSLKSLKNCSNILSNIFCFDFTDIDSGLEYMPLRQHGSKRSSFIECFGDDGEAKTKCVVIQDQLRPFDYDLEA